MNVGHCWHHKPKRCTVCKKKITGRVQTARHCWSCVDKKLTPGLHPIKDRARSAVAVAIRKKLIAPLNGAIMCVDCLVAPATDYDHRDYSKPLIVEPTCRSCNMLRGPGKVSNKAKLRADRRTAQRG